MVTSVAPRDMEVRRTPKVREKVTECKHILEKMVADRQSPKITLSRKERFPTVRGWFLDAAKELNLRIYFNTIKFGSVRPAGYIDQTIRVEPRVFVISF